MISMRSVAAALLVVAAAACDRESEADERDRAAGRILPASVSDAMIETDRSQIEPPIADPGLLTDGSGDEPGTGEPGQTDAPRASGVETPPAAAGSEPARPRATPAAQATRQAPPAAEPPTGSDRGGERPGA